ncbi:MAG: PorP/SprF family type IX secretion system membrane protein [Bacteroidetes bacterium]|nr:PorP/SprF family type IX secretion system membrane protein [Bacteroidota bacterium]
MKNKLIFFVLFTMLRSAALLYGQDPGGVQFSNKPLYYNPAYTGLFDGLRVRFSYRNQGPSLNPPFRSLHFSTDIAGRNLPGAGGVGLIVNTDNEGIGFIRNYNLGLSISARVPFSGFILGQLGMKVAWLHKTIAWDDFALSEKLRENYGGIYDSGFTSNSVNVLNLPDLAIGGLVQFIAAKGRLSGTVGLAIDHIFEPDVSFLKTEKASLTRKWVCHADLIWVVQPKSGYNGAKEEVFMLSPGLLFQHQGVIKSLQSGIMASKYGLYAGAWYRGEFGPHPGNSLALSGGYRYFFAENMSIKFTYSYEKPLTGMSKTSGGTHEIGLLLEFSNFRLFRNAGGSSMLSNSPGSLDERLSHMAF